MFRPHVLLFAAIVVGGSLGSARANPFTYADFSSTAGLQLNGSAAQAGNVLRLTPAAVNQAGSAFTTTTISLGNLASFSTHFQFQITNSGGINDGDGQGADGIVFTIQTVSNNVGGAGGGIGYLGISPSLGIEFDSWLNSESIAQDPNGNHVGINTNGSVMSLTTAAEPTRFNNGAIWNAWIDYDGNTNDLEVRWSMSTTRPALPGLATNIDLQALLGQNTAYLGFTSGTGSAFGNHDILNWQFRDEFNPIGPAAVPEPASLAVVGAGLALLGFRARGRKKAATPA